jgi:hypothetical protein
MPAVVLTSFTVPRRVCFHCKREDFVRAERVFKGGSARTTFFCGACLHTWEEVDAQSERHVESREKAVSHRRVRTA